MLITMESLFESAPPSKNPESEVNAKMSTPARSARKSFAAFEKQLASQRNELRMRIDRHRLEVVADREPDDEVGTAWDNVSRDMLAATIERERRTLNEIESALMRMKKGEYGICDQCGGIIPNARLEALPWARPMRPLRGTSYVSRRASGSFLVPVLHTKSEQTAVRLHCKSLENT